MHVPAEAGPVLSRTADSLFWLSRYVERAENTARILEAAYRLATLPAAYGGHTNEWESAVAAAGSLDAFDAAYSEATAENVIEFLAFSETNPSSIRSCIDIARQNARSVRVALTVDMWDAINGAWLELQEFKPSEIVIEELPGFLGWVKNASLRFDGSALRTMLRNDAYRFSQLGACIERADSTARILDVKYHVLLPHDAPVGGGLDYAQWSSILRAVSAVVSYHWIYRESLRPWLIADLLILRKEMPRSLAACQFAMTRHLDAIAEQYGRQGESQRMARAMHARLSNSRIEDIFPAGLHEFLQDFIAENNRLGSAIAEQYLV